MNPFLTRCHSGNEETGLSNGQTTLNCVLPTVRSPNGIPAKLWPRDRVSYHSATWGKISYKVPSPYICLSGPPLPALPPPPPPLSQGLGGASLCGRGLIICLPPICFLHLRLQFDFHTASASLSLCLCPTSATEPHSEARRNSSEFSQ